MPTSDAALFTVAQMRKRPKCALTDERMKKMRCVHTMEYCVTLRKGTLQHVTTHVNFEDTALSEMSRSQKEE